MAFWSKKKIIPAQQANQAQPIPISKDKDSSVTVIAVPEDNIEQFKEPTEQVKQDISSVSSPAATEKSNTTITEEDLANSNEQADEMNEIEEQTNDIETQPNQKLLVRDTNINSNDLDIDDEISKLDKKKEDLLRIKAEKEEAERLARVQAQAQQELLNQQASEQVTQDPILVNELEMLKILYQQQKSLDIRLANIEGVLLLIARSMKLDGSK